MADNVAITAGSGTIISTEEVTRLNGATVPAQHAQRSLSAIRTADGTAIDLPGDTSNGLDVDVTRSALPAGASTSANQTTIIGHIDGIEAQLTTLAGYLDGLEGLVDGLEGGIGTSGDAAAVAGGTGSLNAKIRLATTQLADAVTSLQRLDDAISGSEIQVDVVTLPALPTGTNNIGDVDIVGGLVAHDAGDSGNPVKVGGRARTALPAAVAQDDRVDAIHDKYGRQLALVAPLDQRRSGTVNLTSTTGADVIAAPGASTAVVVTRILVVNGHASVGTKVSVRDGTTVKATAFAAAGGGGWTIEDPNGLFVAAANTAVTAICGTSGADVDVTVFGYTIPT